MSRKSNSERKESKKRRQREEVQENQEVFDVLALLRSENLDTKPNFAKFLEKYVHDIRTCVGGKMQFYPTLKYNTRKVFVTFLDGHELIYYHKVDFPNQTRYYLEWKMEDVEMKPRDYELVQRFFELLIQFKFVVLAE